jgi:hypothetical protein
MVHGSAWTLFAITQSSIKNKNAILGHRTVSSN